MADPVIEAAAVFSAAEVRLPLMLAVDAATAVAVRLRQVRDPVMLALLPVTCRAVTVPGVVALPLVSIASLDTEPMLAAMAVRVPVRGTEVEVRVLDDTPATEREPATASEPVMARLPGRDVLELPV